ncbi:MADS-box protein FLOWERING LOCUS C-like [Papaver somniferum]|uniref:MADS-box protein FLOWERING LOCUS C-like n=1 Tax=Papaver somniferum TaxID=3469 RepID=UPI000E6FB14F|nr:MADS-box protein FLOWERING LOCUS C-like [Papaver somniferum]
MGRKKIEIEKIENPTKRMVTFSKRRGGIESKAAELCKLFPDIIISIIVFSPGGKAFTFSNSPLGVCNMVERFLKEEAKDKKQEDRNSHEAKNSTYVQECTNKAGVGSGSDSYWWHNIDMEELDSVEKLKSVRESLANLKQNLSARKEKLTAAALSPLSSPSSTIEDTIIEDRIVEDAATSITEKHEAWKICCKELDLSLNLGW